ncbi:MAG TPA: metal ABC transporter substrate-binding protein [Frankiaceae bacterium]|nr:metal ABC transporter substrate-binding protein [Frankiaceae bacterium]
MRKTWVAALCAAVVLPGCVRDGAASGRLTVVTGVYPVRMLVERIGGDRVEVVDIAPPGAEPHDVELSPTQVGQVEQADLVVVIRGFQPALDDAAPDDRTLDLLAQAGGTDPHVWLDPVLLAGATDAVARALAERDPDHAAGYRDRAEALGTGLVALGSEIGNRLASCPRKDLVTSHAAFGRFAARYGLRETGISGVDAEAEPSPRRLADVAALVRRNGVTTVFAESDDDPPARTVAREADVAVAVLDPVEVFRGDDYYTVMQRNAAAVATALGCR